MQQWIGRVLASPDVVLDPQPTAQLYSDVNVDRPARFGDGAYLEVAQHEVSTCPPALWSLARITLSFFGGLRDSLSRKTFSRQRCQIYQPWSIEDTSSKAIG